MTSLVERMAAPANNFLDHIADLQERVGRLERYPDAGGDGSAAALADESYLVLGFSTDLSNERVLTVGNGLVDTDLGAGSTYTVALGAPSSVSVLSTNLVTGGTHYHAAATSSNPGATQVILATALDGGLQLLRLGIGTDPDTDNAVKVVTATWVGLGAAAGRIEFDNQATDEINFIDCNVGIGISVPETKLHLASSNANCAAFIDTYDDGSTYSYILFRKSDTDTIGTTTQTDDGDNIGGLIFYGVDNTAAFDYGAYILATQEGASGVRAPMRIQIATYSATTGNLGIILNSAGRVGINIAVGEHAAQLHVDQNTADAGIPVLLLDQADTSEGCIDFVASARGAITGATNSVESVRVELNGTVYRLALYADA